MFTGIITGRGSVTAIEKYADGSAKLLLDAGVQAEDLAFGGSIAVDGVCLTAVGIDRGMLSIDMMGETLSRTTLGRRGIGDLVNLERCVVSGERLDGHVVQGHVDGVGTLLERADLGSWHRLRFALPRPLARYLAEKGSIAIDGISLTVNEVSAATDPMPWFEVGLIPVTLENTGLGGKKIGDEVNLEVDVLAKYTERLLGFARGTHSGPTADADKDPARSILDPIEDAIAAIAAGRAVVVVDDEGRENEGDIIFAAEHSTPELMGWTVRHSSGVICAPMSNDRADVLGLALMVARNEEMHSTAFTVSCDAMAVESSGISATDRSITARVLADPGTAAKDLTRPGHIFPLRAVAGGVRERPGHTEAAVELAVLAGCAPVGVISEVVRDDGEMMRRDELRQFASQHGCLLVSIADLAQYLEMKEAVSDVQAVEV